MSKPDPSPNVAITLEATGPAYATPSASQTYALTVSSVGNVEPEDLVVRLFLANEMEPTEVSHGGEVQGTTIQWAGLGASLAQGSVNLEVHVIPPAKGPFRVRSEAVWIDGETERRTTAQEIETILTFESLYTLEGTEGSGQFGWEMENLGDIDGDGAGDFAVSAAAISTVYVYSGADGREIYRFQNGGRAGLDMDTGDVDGDGIVDLIVGAPGLTGTEGDVFVYSMAGGQIILHLSGESTNDQFGWNATFLGDIDQDGADDIIVGANLRDISGLTDAGSVYIYSGRSGELLWQMDLEELASTTTFEIPVTAQANFGHAARGVGDLNADGIPDFAVGAPGISRIFVFSGSDFSLLHPPLMVEGANNLGAFWISSPGDWNSDGVPDIYAADLGSEEGIGAIFSGMDGSLITTLAGESPGDQFGIGHPAPDMNGDGVNDMIIAAWLRTEGEAQAGKVYIVSGATQDILQTFTGTQEGQRLGFDAVVVDDLTGDGQPDFLLSGNVISPINPDSPGEVYVVAGGG